MTAAAKTDRTTRRPSTGDLPYRQEHDDAGNVKLTVERPLIRQLEVRQDTLDADARTVELAFSSESPVLRFGWFEDFWEVLDHGTDSIDFGRMNNGAPLLMDHDSRRQIGVMANARVDADGVGRAVARFSRSPEAELIFQDIADGIRSKVSVGYLWHDVELDDDEGPDGLPVYRVTLWEPLEVSMVSIPADDSVGVGRAGAIAGLQTRSFTFPSKRQNIMPEQETTPTPTEQPTPQPTQTVLRVEPQPLTAEEKRNHLDQVREAEIGRLADLHTMRQQFGKYFSDDDFKKASQPVDKGGLTAEQARAQIMSTMAEDTGRQPGRGERVDHPHLLDMERRDVQRYSFRRALVSQASNRPDLAEFEQEVSRSAKDKLSAAGLPVGEGIVIPMDVLRSMQIPWRVLSPVERRSMLADYGAAAMHRVMTTGGAATGAELVGTEHMGAMFIEFLYNRTLLVQMGAIVLENLVGNLAIPKQTSSAGATWEGETGTKTAVDIGTGTVPLSAKRVVARTDASLQLLRQSDPSADGIILRDLAMSQAIAIDRAGLVGASPNGPTGIINESGVGLVDNGTNGGALTWAKAVEFETLVAAANADFGSMGYLANANTRGKLKTTEKAATTAQFIWQASPMAGDDPTFFGGVNGYRAGVTNQLPNDGSKGGGTNLSTMLFGNFQSCLIGMWGGMEIIQDPYSKAEDGVVRFVVTNFMDEAVRWPQAFSYADDIVTA